MGKHLIRILIVSDVRFYREGLARVLDLDERFAIVGAASSASEAVACVYATQFDVVLIDMRIENSLKAAQKILERTHEAKVITFAMPATIDHVNNYTDLGISGYLTRDCSLDELIECVDATANRRSGIFPTIAGSQFHQNAATTTLAHEETALPHLTKREVCVLGLIDEGLSNKEIARVLDIEIPTVKNHVHNILEKLQARSRGEASAIVRRLEKLSDRRLRHTRQSHGANDCSMNGAKGLVTIGALPR